MVLYVPLVVQADAATNTAGWSARLFFPPLIPAGLVMKRSGWGIKLSGAVIKLSGAGIIRSGWGMKLSGAGIIHSGWGIKLSVAGTLLSG